MASSINSDETHEMIASNKVEGTAVFDSSGSRMGKINHLMVGKRSGQAEYAVMKFGGFLGIGADYYPIPWDLLRYDVNQGGYVVYLEKDMLNEAPRYSDQKLSFDAQYNQQGCTYSDLS